MVLFIYLSYIFILLICLFLFIYLFIYLLLSTFRRPFPRFTDSPFQGF